MGFYFFSKKEAISVFSYFRLTDLIQVNASCLNEGEKMTTVLEGHVQFVKMMN